jgi:hypothetical protein
MQLAEQCGYVNLDRALSETEGRAISLLDMPCTISFKTSR